jgi:hypothetical protein
MRYIDSSLLNGNMLNWCSSTVNRRATKCDTLTAAYWAGTCSIDVFPPLTEGPQSCDILTAAYWAGTCSIDVFPSLTEGPQSAIYWQQLTERERAQLMFFHRQPKGRKVRYVDSSLLSGNVLNWCSSTVNRRAQKCDTLTAAYWAGTCSIDVFPPLTEEP